ncbi:hypothetical protein N8J89_15110 [Crossiella sp. CA-258035]|uniref:hypothetical protein n=1 Tax=Crossiella sp. CA-258035 TaxID=2981138 RepID=UPI0024BC8649|nr:hypothetical protein [Crossiella sp. CA-258035]WHT22341.1 hypothetical protein N8J89_15110 [Crossiella sp. CA-258035]
MLRVANRALGVMLWAELSGRDRFEPLLPAAERSAPSTLQELAAAQARKADQLADRIEAVLARESGGLSSDSAVGPARFVVHQIRLFARRARQGPLRFVTFNHEVARVNRVLDLVAHHLSGAGSGVAV